MAGYWKLSTILRFCKYYNSIYKKTKNKPAKKQKNKIIPLNQLF